MKILSSLCRPRALKRKGILGMNKRNHRYIGRYNDRRYYPLVDDKLKTKQVALAHHCTTPQLIGVIDAQYQVPSITDMVRDHQGFVIKPAKGSGGKGILVINGQQNNTYIKPSGQALNTEDVERHVSNILAGLYSLGGKNDVAVVESLIEFDARFAPYSVEGVPDVRIIVFQGYPVMAMMRLSTHASDGKANLHQGAVGVGLDIATGKASHAVQFGKSVTHHPDTQQQLNQLEVPDWQELLTLAATGWEMTKLGYLGADIVIDKRYGPMLLELNARPGLAIQVANGQGLIPRLDAIEQQVKEAANVMPALERVKFSMSRFADPTADFVSSHQSNQRQPHMLQAAI